MPVKEKSTFSHFFKEDASVIQDVIQGTNDQQIVNKVGAANKEVFPKISSSGKADDDEFKAQWKQIRSFFRNGENTAVLEDLTPVAMAPLYTSKMVGFDFPVWVADENYSGEGEFCVSLKEILSTCLNEIGPEESDAHILKENIERILHIANNLLADDQPRLFQSAIIEILDELEKQLDVSGDEVKSFNQNLKNLKKRLPDFGALLPYSASTSFQLLEAASVATLGESRKVLQNDLKQLKCRLKDMLRVEREKGPERKNPEKLKDSMGFVDSMMDFKEISSIIPGGGSEIMDAERVKRISAVVEDLEQMESLLDQSAFLFVDETTSARSNFSELGLFEGATIEYFNESEGCEKVMKAFEENIQSWTTLFKAIRIGELEFESSYQSDVHDDFFEHFNWKGFTSEELSNCPKFLLIADDIQLFNTELSQLSVLLSNNIPVKVVAVKSDNHLDYKQNGSSNDDGLHAHAELGALMLSYKNIYVAQSTSITPQQLFHEFTEGLTAFAPAFFHVFNVNNNAYQNNYLWTSAVVESRDFPGFSFKGLLGTSWGSRFSIENNPSSDTLWSTHRHDVIDGDGNKTEMSFPFTFADYATLNPSYHQYFMMVDSAYWSENLIPLTDYMADSVEENLGKVPFIWMMDSTNELRKVAVSWPVVLATQERMDFWRFLQENSGINNYHVGQAVEKAQTEMQQQFDIELAQLKEEHQKEIQTIKEEEAGVVMENLTSVLLNLDTSTVVTSPAPLSPSKTTADKVDEPEAVAATSEPEASEEGLLSNDPYIDTALCTSCNECVNMNGNLFKYNSDKMAFINDPKAGTFSELVEAAELCPVGIIHPGSPLDPNEPDLDSLVERAAKFN